MSSLRFAVIGAGFWSQFQLAAWGELEGAECVAVCDRVRAKAEALARGRGVPAVYEDPEELFRRERLDFVDIITDLGTHAALAQLAAAHRIYNQRLLGQHMRAGVTMVDPATTWIDATVRLAAPRP